MKIVGHSGVRLKVDKIYDVINLIYIVQFDTNGIGILTALYIQMQYMHIWTYLK